MLQYSTNDASIMTSAQIAAELERSAWLQQVETGCNPATARYSDVKREFEASLNFKLYCSFGRFVSIITHNDGTTKEAIMCSAREMEDYYADVCYYDPSRLGPFAKWGWTRKPFIDRWLYDMSAAVIHQVINDPMKPHGLLLGAEERQTTEEGFLLPPDYNLCSHCSKPTQSFDALKRLQCAEAARRRAVAAAAEAAC
jgi:hypothetical protein